MPPSGRDFPGVVPPGLGAPGLGGYAPGSVVLADSDPGAVGPGVLWIVPSTGAASVRDADDDGWIVVSGGGPGLPVTIDESGTYTFAPASGDPNLRLVGSADSNDVLAITDTDHPTEINFGVDPFGYVSATGLDAESPNDVTVLRVQAAQPAGAFRVHDFFQVVGTAALMRITGAGRFLLTGASASVGSGGDGGDLVWTPGVKDGAGRNGLVFLNLPTADPGVPGALFSLAGVVKVSP